MAGDLEELARRARAIVAGLMLPELGSPLEMAHTYARALEDRALAFLDWVDSSSFPAIAVPHRDRFRTAAGRLQTSGRRLAAATERRRVDELIERAAEAMQQADVLLRRAVDAVMRDVQGQLDAVARARRRS
jgi:hypothetical protein